MFVEFVSSRCIHNSFTEGDGASDQTGVKNVKCGKGRLSAFEKLTVYTGLC